MPHIVGANFWGHKVGGAAAVVMPDATVSEFQTAWGGGD